VDVINRSLTTRAFNMGSSSIISDIPEQEVCLMASIWTRFNSLMLVLVFLALLAVLGMLATGVRGGPLDPSDPPGSTMKSLDDIPGSWSRALPANDGLPGPDPKAGCDSSRFECLDDFFNAVVLDRETGLVWYIEAGGLPLTWTGAQDYCLNFPAGTVNGARFGWHLPTFEELLTLFQPSPGAPSLPFGNPFTILTDDKYWTATSVSLSNARELSFVAPFGGLGEPKTNENYAWCVRGGHGYDGP
jgi:hypothetical protein